MMAPRSSMFFTGPSEYPCRISCARISPRIIRSGDVHSAISSAGGLIVRNVRPAISKLCSLDSYGMGSQIVDVRTAWRSFRSAGNRFSVSRTGPAPYPGSSYTGEGTGSSSDLRPSVSNTFASSSVGYPAARLQHKSDASGCHTDERFGCGLSPAHDYAKSTSSFELDLRHASGRSRSARMAPAHGIWLNGVSRGVTVNPVWSRTPLASIRE